MERYIKSNICPLPWTSLEVGVNGGAAPCCLYKGQVPNTKVYKTSLKDIQKNEYMEDLRKQFKNGKKPIGCSNCWAEESAGKTSKRMNSLYKMKDKIQNYINLKFLIAKRILVTLLIIVAIISIPIISFEGNKAFKHALEWDYFLGVIFFYCLTFFMWKKTNS